MTIPSKFHIKILTLFPEMFPGMLGMSLSGKALERNIRFLQIETSHQDEIVKSDQAYLYFWPGGQTERASIQLSVGGSTLETEVVSILISPLTGKADIKRGKVAMLRPRDDIEESERRDTGF